jgi:tetratricopeptide (TPR) repeat protein
LAEGRQEAAEEFFQKVGQQYNENKTNKTNKTVSLNEELSLQVAKGRAFAHLKLFVRALSCYHEALKLKGDYQPALIGLEQLWSMQGAEISDLKAASEAKEKRITELETEISRLLDEQQREEQMIEQLQRLVTIEQELDSIRQQRS